MRTRPPVLATAAIVVTYLFAGCVTTSREVAGLDPFWQQQFEHDVEFQALVDESLLVVATGRHLHGLDPASGQRRWRMRNVHAGAGDIIPVGDAPYLLISDSSGGPFDDSGTNLLAVERAGGSILWESPLLPGKVLQAAVDNVRGVLFVVSVTDAHGDDRGVLSKVLPGKGLFAGLEREPVLHGIELSTGRLLWSRPFGSEVPLQPARPVGSSESEELEFTRPFDLGLYHGPVIVDDRVCVSYAGLYCYRTATGEPLWDQQYRTLEDDLALSYANPVADKKALYTSGETRLRAFDTATGEPVWRSRRLAPIPELYVDDNRVYAQLGGRFFDIGDEEWTWRGPFGAAAVDRATGDLAWRFDDAADAVTNLLVYGDRVWLADADELIALDRRSGQVLVRLEHELRQSPVYLALNEDRRILLVGEHEVAACHEVTGKRLWHSWHAPARPSLWTRFSSGLLHATGSVLKLGSYVVANVSGLLPAIPSLSLPLGGLKVKLVNTRGVVADSSGSTGRRFVYQSGSLDDTTAAAHLRGGYQFFVTEVRGHGPALAMVDLRSGETVRIMELPAGRPGLLIDEEHQRVYQANGNRLVALPTRQQ